MTYGSLVAGNGLDEVFCELLRRSHIILAFPYPSSPYMFSEPVHFLYREVDKQELISLCSVAGGGMSPGYDIIIRNLMDLTWG